MPGGEGCVFWTKEDGVSWCRFSLDGDAILFFGRGSSEPGTDCDRLEGTFLWWNGSIEHLSDSRGASIDGGLVAFHKDGVIYARELGEAPTRIVGPGDPVPGRSAVFDVVSGVWVSAGRLAFRGRDTAGRWGVYLSEGGTLSVLAEEGAPLLPRGPSLGFLQAFLLGTDRFAVIGSSSQGSLLYLKPFEQVWERVIDESELRIVCCAGVSEFAGNQLVVHGVVLRADGSLSRVLRSGDMLDGRRVRWVLTGTLGTNEVVLVVEFEDSPTHHLYLAELPPIPVEIDVKPRRATNRLHPRSRRSIPIAILGSETFPVEDMDATSIEIGPNAAPARGRPKLRDVNDDGWTDLVVRFRPRDAGIARSDSQVCLSSETHDGIGFEGCDAVTLGR